MKKNKALGLVATDIILMALDVGAILGLLYLERKPIIVAGLMTVIFISIPLFFYLNFTAISDNKKTDYLIEDLDEDEEFIAVFNRFKKSPALSDKVNVAIEQLNRLDNKAQIIEKVLLQNYNEGLGEFASISGVIDDTREIIYKNMRNIVNQMTILDENDLNEVYNSSNISNNIKVEKRKNFNNKIYVIRDLLDKNEYVLLEIDKLIDASANSTGKNTSSKDLDKIRDIVGALVELNTTEEDNEVALDNMISAYDDLENETGAKNNRNLEDKKYER